MTYIVWFQKGPIAAELRIAVAVQLSGEALEGYGSDPGEQQLGQKRTRSGIEKWLESGSFLEGEEMRFAGR